MVKEAKSHRKSLFSIGQFWIAQGVAPGAIDSVGRLRDAKSPELPVHKN
jgi:hypothetical protein